MTSRVQRVNAQMMPGLLLGVIVSRGIADPSESSTTGSRAPAGATRASRGPSNPATAASCLTWVPDGTNATRWPVA
jgi:hypothetical protein